jgi:predicted metalloprotease
MLWTPGGRSPNLEDRRSSGGGMGRGLGIGGTVVVLALSLLFGRNLFTDLGVAPAGVSSASEPLSPADSAAQETEVQFVSFVLDDVQKTWASTLSNSSVQFHPAKLVLFRNSTESGCGTAQSAMGPFYCPTDERVYLDLGFFDELKQKFSASGDFAQAYVIAHELGHHIQHLQGIDAQMRQAQESDPSRANQMSVALELQADCYAGVWAHSTQGRTLQAGDVDEALGAASSVGDDRIQQRTTGRVNVDSFTHGSAAQRSASFKRGMETGDPRSCAIS